MGPWLVNRDPFGLGISMERLQQGSGLWEVAPRRA